MFIYHLTKDRACSPYEDGEIIEYVVVAIHEKEAFVLCSQADREYWNIRKLGTVTADVWEDTDTGIISHVTR